MKKLAKLPLWPAKVILVIWFIANTGCLQTVHQLAKAAKAGPRLEHQEYEKARRIIDFEVEKKDSAAVAKVDLGGKYTIHDYFKDYGDLRLLSDSLKMPHTSMMGTAMMRLSRQDLHTMDYTGQSGKEIAKAQADYYARTKDPLCAPHNPKPIIWGNVFSVILAWLFMKYLACFMPSFFLLLMWFWKKEKQTTLASVLSFIISFVLYPITIGWIFVSKAKNLYESAEIRSRKEKLFSVVTERELDIVRRVFAENKSYGKAKAYFAEAKIERKHSFAYALVVTLLLQIVPQTFAQAQTAESKKQAQDSKEVIFAKLTPQLTSSDVSVGVASLDDCRQLQNDWQGNGSAEHSASPTVPLLFAKLIKIIPKFYHYVMQDVHDRIDHVPLPVVLTLVNSTNSFTTKHFHNEENKHYFDCRNGHLRTAHLCTSAIGFSGQFR